MKEIRAHTKTHTPKEKHKKHGQYNVNLSEYAMEKKVLVEQKVSKGNNNNRNNLSYLRILLDKNGKTSTNQRGIVVHRS